VSADHKSRNWQKHILVNVGKQCVANYVHLIVKIYNQIEDNVLRICLLDRAYTVLQDINSVQKNVYLALTVTMRLTNIPGIVLVFARMYIQCSVMQFNTLFIIFYSWHQPMPKICVFLKFTAEAFWNNFLKHINNSSSLNNVNHNCDGVWISDFIWHRCDFESPFSP